MGKILRASGQTHRIRSRPAGVRKVICFEWFAARPRTCTRSSRTCWRAVRPSSMAIRHKIKIVRKPHLPAAFLDEPPATWPPRLRLIQWAFFSARGHTPADWQASMGESRDGRRTKLNAPKAQKSRIPTGAKITIMGRATSVIRLWTPARRNPLLKAHGQTGAHQRRSLDGIRPATNCSGRPRTVP